MFLYIFNDLVEVVADSTREAFYIYSTLNLMATPAITNIIKINK